MGVWVHGKQVAHGKQRGFPGEECHGLVLNVLNPKRGGAEPGSGSNGQ